MLLDASTTSVELELSGLRKGTNKNADIILVPQPSNDPNDPLNWPLWQRDAILVMYCCCTVCVTGGYASMHPGRYHKLTAIQRRPAPIIDGAANNG